MINPIQPDLFPDRLHLKREDLSRNMRRYYIMAVQKDLFGGATLIREWGRIGSAGTMRTTRHQDEGQAVDALASIAMAKQKRGYRFAA